jgi:hypothetical protein
MPRKKSTAQQDAPAAADQQPAEAVELPARDAMTLIDPGLLGVATVPGMAPGVGDATADPAQLANQTGAQAPAVADPAAAHLADVASATANDAGDAAATAQPYQPSVTSVARS